MRCPVSARVTGFDYTTHHAYTTEVAADGRSWRLALRYNTFYRFYAELLAVEPQFRVPFPPKGGLFFSPQPEERQQQLDDFVQNTLTFFDLRGRPGPMGKLLDDLLEVSAHLDAPEEEDKEEEQQPAVEETKAKEDESKETKETKEKKREEAPAMGGLLNSKWAKALVSAAMQAVVVNTFQENVEAGKAKAKADETSKGKAVDAADVDTPASPASRASLTKTPRQSATVAPLAVSSPFDTPTKPETKVETKVETKSETKAETKAETKSETKSNLRVDATAETLVDDAAPVVVANVAVGAVRSRIAVWERRASSPTPRSAGQRSSSCSSAGDQAPVMPLGISDVPKPVIKTSEVAVETAKVEKVEQHQVEEQQVEEEETAAEVEIEPTVEVETPAEKKETAAVEVEAVETVEDATTDKEAATEETTEAESDGYDSDASDEIRQLGLAKLDVSERLRFYRHPVFFQGFYCDVRTSLVADAAGRA